MEKDKYQKILTRYITGNYSEDDERIILEWLEEDPEREAYMEELRETWRVTGDLQLEQDVDHSWKRLSDRLNLNAYQDKVTRIEKSKSYGLSNNMITHMLRAAAVILVVFGGYYFYSQSGKRKQAVPVKKEAAYSTIHSKPGEQVHFRFNDGTKVVLNASSNIRYPSNYGKESREIYLQGEAYFEVVHNEDQPFTIHVNRAKVQDIGTKFDIKAYQDDDATDIVVAEGKVAVTPRYTAKAKQGKQQSSNSSGSSNVVLTEGKKVRITDQAGTLQVLEADLNHAMGWLKGRLIFDADPFNEVMGKISRFYDVNTEVADSAILRRKLTASFENEKLDKVLDVVSMSMGIDYKKEGNTIKFTLKK